MAYNINPSKRVIKYLRKLKNRQLKEKFTDAIYGTIANDPYVGNEKHGDLSSYFAYGFKYDRVDYRIAYTINDDNEIVIVVLAGSHEKFYEQLKRIVNR
ncbi:addiction module toxin RelE [Lactobacillus sp. UMNPBX10]|uniref:type II toxin-antitoxin system RelE/ParE family toxin n=1 Tax=Limosilactobacillus reuteri TaxID=1598 RepID=UPI000B39C6B9|nr:type II toxin-antitoxin system RelE/ParE family toxin [Limosilactobacillus reuteri]OUP90821.1 addiction module toxin RelE [Limosilactobacillus reuteri]PEG94683.1 addiction module toxin RelE [Lactobacillus sp. UMNPBX10]